ncbi:purple acid phosphatase 18-like protein [Carex littledalei]|uniref:Purple acid phosphatase n=1 Tax=Carex littledalei TaxID=544730 RepID=A0A833QP18_9POAL|nr:purple acid phosphatase 18-like protein [Carex littledalei]
MELRSIILLLFLFSSTINARKSEVVRGEDYVRPRARKALASPWQLKKESSTGPQQVHISLAGENQMRVTWITESSNYPSTVQYGTSPGIYPYNSTGETTSYTYLMYTSGTIHHTTIGPLVPSTTYYYRLSNQGPEFKFKTPPNEFPITFAIVGDLGQTDWSVETLAHVKKCNYDVLLMPGDLSYADYQQHLWDTFGNLVQPLASERPWMVTEGNHEKEKIWLLESGFQAYNSRWKMPFEESGSGSNLYYSFDTAGVHVVMLGSYTDYDKESDQYNWLKRDLAKVDRKKTPWLIVVLHAPWYNSNWAHYGEGDAMMASMEPLLYEAGVDLLVAGHVHAYERSRRVYKGKVDSCGTMHITIGDGGNREGLAKRYHNPKPSWSIFREASFGHGELQIVNSTHAFWSWHRNDDDELVTSDDD